MEGCWAMKNCNSQALKIKTYHGGLDQVTHPSLVSFATPWHGYLHYMSYTPYPYANPHEENPSIAASNDLIHWEKPDGLINPIAHCIETETDELKDSHLLYREDLDRLECWYMGRVRSTYKENGPLHLFRKLSYDGVHWSEYEIMHVFATWRPLSPSVIFNGTGYDLWCIDKENGGKLFYLNCTDGAWSEPIECTVPDSVDIWHGSVSLIGSEYCFTWMGYKEATGKIYCARGNEPTAFEGTKTVLVNSAGWAQFYRPFLHFYEGEYYLFYGVVDNLNRWYIALNKGECLDALDCVPDCGGACAFDARIPKPSAKERLVALINLEELWLIIPTVYALNKYPKYTWALFAALWLVCAADSIFRFKRSFIKSIACGLVNIVLIFGIAAFTVMLIQSLFD